MRGKTRYLAFVIILFISIGFAYTTTTLGTFGNAFVKANKWRIYWDNFQLSSGSVESVETPVITEENGWTRISMREDWKTIYGEKVERK